MDISSSIIIIIYLLLLFFFSYTIKYKNCLGRNNYYLNNYKERSK